MKKMRESFHMTDNCGYLSYGKYGSWKECNRCNS